MMTQSPLNAKEIIRRVRQLEYEEEASDVTRLIYHSSDFGVTSVVDNPKVSNVTRLILCDATSRQKDSLLVRLNSTCNVCSVSLTSCLM